MAPLSSLSKQDIELMPSDEDDEDFTLDNDSESSSEDSEDDEPSAKRTKVEDKVEPAMTKQAVDDLWASFNAPEPTKPTSVATATPAMTATSHPSASTPAISTSATPALSASGPKPKAEMVKIKVTYDFVGEKIEEDKMVAADSPEAIAYFALHPKEKPSTLDSLFGDEPTPAAASTIASTSAPPPPPTASTSAPIPAPSGAPKRRKAGGLAAMAASLGGKPAKLTTLEKSKLDWNKHVSKEGLQDDLTKARKDGFLDKKDFLDRAAAAKEDEYDKLRRGGRR